MTLTRSRFGVLLDPTIFWRTGLGGGVEVGSTSAGAAVLSNLSSSLPDKS